jgi:hypothetical protein
MLSEHDCSSSMMIFSAMTHAVTLLKSYTPDLDSELLPKDYPFEEDEERDVLIDNVSEIVQYFVSRYDFSMVNDHDDHGSPGTQS